MQIGPYTIVCQNFDQTDTPNYSSERATLEVFKNGKSQMTLYPERRFFKASQITQTLVGIQSTPLRDIYLVYDGRDPETKKPQVHAYLNPLVKCIWFGGLVVVLGTILALIPSRQPVLVISRATDLAPAAAGGPLPQPLGVVHGQD